MNSVELFIKAGIQGVVPSFEVSDVIFDSRKAGPGKIFVALRGSHTDGHKFIKNALEDGCEIAVSEDICDKCVVVPDTKIALAYLSHAFYNFPAKSLRLCGITATNGKTTTTHMIATLLRAVDPKVGLIGTAGHYLPTGRIQPDINNPTTTPYPTITDGYLKIMKEYGSKYAVLELSSFGLDGGRVIGLEFDSMAIGNITHCHHAKLHKTHEKYVDIKLHALDLLKDNGVVVLNEDDEYFESAKKIAGKKRMITFGKDSGNLSILSYKPNNKGSTVSASIFGKKTSYQLPIPSFANALNSLTALGIVEGLGLDSIELTPELIKMPEIPGRWNWIDEGQPFIVFIDKANTPAALETVVEHMNTIKPHRKIIITNNVGEGDPSAREKMAVIAAKGADLTIITYGVAKNEDLDFTVDQFANFLEKYGGNYKIIRDRTESIHYAIKQSEDNDCIAILGRGDEDGMSVYGKWIEVDDRVEARRALNERGYHETYSR